MVLEQAETEGYSVFVIRKAGSGGGHNEEDGEGVGWGDGGVGVMPESEADRIVLELGDPVGRTSGSANVGRNRQTGEFYLKEIH